MAAISIDGTPMTALPSDADQINYDNTSSGLSATQVQDAIDEVNEIIDTLETALSNKVDKVSGKGLSTNDFTDDYKAAIGNNKGAIEAIVNEYGAKNLLSNRATSQTLNGVTFTVNTDGSVTVDGTATAKTDFNIARQDVDGFHLGSGSYTINGCPEGGSSESYHLLMSVNNTWGTKDIGQGVTVNGTIEAVVIRVMSGVTVGNKTFYPMVRDARILDGTYVPFTMTNKQLMAGKQDKYETVTYAQWQALTPAQQAEKDYYISDYPSSAITAGNVSYNNSSSGMVANNVQSAVDELKSGLTNLIGYRTITQTTNEHGSAVINTNAKVIGIYINEMPSGASYTYRLGQAGNTVYLHLMNEEGASASGVTITFTYYTITS